MGKIVLITGGARSGKSNYAESMAKIYENKDVAYIATSLPIDEEMRDRIKRHQKNRPNDWITFENYSKIDNILENNFTKKLFLVDCITIMVTNLIFDYNKHSDEIDSKSANDINDKILAYINNILIICRNNNFTIFFVTNEVGMGIVPDNSISRVFRDIAGRVNQRLAAESDDVYFRISGIPVKIK
jgi:adenosylcobinamide kinase / adenosylcobinamide-phosphate guanylyltransferase